MTARRHPELRRGLRPRLATLRDFLAHRLLRRGDRPDRSTALSLIAEQERALARLAAEVEANFVAMGAALQEQATHGSGLAHQGERLISLASGGDHDATGDAISLAHNMLVSLEACTQQTEELLTRLDAYRERTGALLKEEAQVERILAPLRVIQTFFRIESVRLPAEMQAGFHALSGEIPKFEQQVRETFGRHAGALDATRRKIEAATARLRAQADGQKSLVAADRERLGHTLTVLAGDAAGARERHARLVELMHEIARDAQSLVVSLQYQDITRQKMEHVRAALQDLRAGDVHAPAWRQTARLEASQCRAVRGELDRALQTIAEGSLHLRGRLDRIQTECWSRRLSGEAGAALTGRISALQRVLQEIQELIEPAAQSAVDAVRVIDSFGSVAADVAATAREMAESMRLIALNAQVLAAQAGRDGAGLLVLAERTYAISEEIRRITENIGHEFIETSAQFAAVRELRDTLDRHVTACRDVFLSRGAEMSRRLDQNRDETLAVFGALTTELEELDRQNAAMARATDIRDAFGRSLEGVEAALLTLAGPEPRHAPTAAMALTHLSQRYTMVSERAVHAAAVGALHPPVPPPCPTIPAGCGPDPVPASPAFGDNVELF